MAQRKRGGQPGNKNALSSRPTRIVLSVKGEIVASYYQKYLEQYGREPDEEDIKLLMKRDLGEPEQVLHLYVKLHRSDAQEVRRIIEQHLGTVQAISLLDDWHKEDEGIRTLYYQRRLTGWDAEEVEEWEDRDIVSDKMIDGCLTEIRNSGLALSMRTEYK